MRKIIHVDMDSFYASVEQADDIRLKNKPVIIGSKILGVVTTASYEARAYGVKSAMPAYQAFKLCPHAIFIYPNRKKYQLASDMIYKIFKRYSSKVQMLALDEAYIDVSDSPSATLIGLEIQKDVYKELNITCSFGVSYNKFLAKTASDINKPNGHFIIKPDLATDFISKLPIHKFYGIGKKTSQKMISLGIYNGADLRELSKEQLYIYFKNKSDFYYNIARGIDNTEVLEYNIRKSISSEKTYYIPKLKQELLDELDTLISNNIKIIKNNSVLVKTIILKYKLSDLKTYTKSLSLISPTDTSKVLYESSHFLLNQISITLPIRLLGISYTNLVSKEDYILTHEKNYEQLIFNFN